MPASASGGSSLGTARTPSAATVEAPHTALHQFQEDVDSFPLPPEMLKVWPDLEGVEGIDGPLYVTLDAPEAELLGYPTPTSAASASQDQYQFDPNDVDALALKSLQATDSPADPPALVSTISKPHDDSPGLDTPPSDPGPSCHPCHPSLPVAVSQGGAVGQPVGVAAPATPYAQVRGSIVQHAVNGPCVAPADPLTPVSATPQSLGDDASRLATPIVIDGDQPAGAPSIQIAAANTAQVTWKHGMPAALPLDCLADDSAHHDHRNPMHVKQAGVLSPGFSRLAEQPLEPLTPTPSRVMNTRSLPTVSQSPSPAPVQWSEEVCRSSSAPPQMGAPSTDLDAFAALGMPSRPKSCVGDLPAQTGFTPALSTGLRDVQSSESPATSPISPVHDQNGQEYKGEPISQLPAVEGLSLQPAPNATEPTEREPIGISTSHVSGEGSRDASQQSLSPRRPQSKWWHAGPSPYQHRPLTLVNVTGSAEAVKVPASGDVPRDQHTALAPVEDDEELSELDSASEAGASEIASTPYLSAVSTPADSSAALHEPLSPSKPVPVPKSKSKGNARQLIDLQTYSTSILGGQTMMSAKRTRQRDSGDISAPADNSPQQSLPPPPKRKKTALAPGVAAVAGAADPAATPTSGRGKKTTATKRKKNQGAGDADPYETAQKRPRQKGKQTAASALQLPIDGADAIAQDQKPTASIHSRSSSTSRSPWKPEETAILKEFFGDGIFNNDKGNLCRAALTKAGFSRSAGAILTRAREQYKKGVFNA